MKKLIFALLSLGLLTTTAFAKYDCNLKIVHLDNPAIVLATKNISIGNEQLKEGRWGTLLVESKKARKTVTLDIEGTMIGWKWDESATLRLKRVWTKKSKTKSEVISADLELTKNDQTTDYFEEYKLDVSCTK